MTPLRSCRGGKFMHCWQYIANDTLFLHDFTINMPVMIMNSVGQLKELYVRILMY